jgi:uncharacterized damage-inducible protein DinB
VNEVLLEAFRYSAWADRELIGFCRRLTPEQLRVQTTGSYGSILSTLQHQVGAESYYASFFGAAFPGWQWDDDVLPSLDQLAAWCGDLAAFWQELLAQPLEAATDLVRSSRHEPAGIVLVQALHHANVHREQVNMVLTALGIEPPDLDVWAFGVATGQRQEPPF